METYYLDKSDIHGTGVFASKDTPSNSIFGVALVKIRDTGIPAEDFARTVLGRYINHQKDGNSELIEKNGIYFLRSIRPIAENEEVTSDYNSGLAFEISGGFPNPFAVN